MRTTYVPVTQNGSQVMIQTNAPIQSIDAAFYTTDSIDELIKRLKSRGYYAGKAQYGLVLNYDQK